jgi:hypothetical protein
MRKIYAINVESDLLLSFTEKKDFEILFQEIDKSNYIIISYNDSNSPSGAVIPSEMVDLLAKHNLLFDE